MITLDQVLLLQKKVETAVERIKTLSSELEQLKTDNDALRSKCAELTKALSDKTEFVSSLESEQDKIESTILHALSQLDVVENSILNTPSVLESGENASQAEQDSASESPLSENTEENFSESDSAQEETQSLQAGIQGAADAYAQQSTSEESIAEDEGDDLFAQAEAAASEEKKDSINSDFDIF